MHDPYAILGVKKTASAAEISRSYRQLAKRLHPDVNQGDPAVTERFQEVSAAYNLLRNAKQRAAFDAGEIDANGNPILRRRAQRADGQAGARRRDDTRDQAQDHSWEHTRAGGGAADAESESGESGESEKDERFFDFLSTLRSARRRAFSTQGDDIEHRIEVDFLTAARGAKLRVELPTGKTLEVAVPAGVEDGQKIRLKGQGHRGSGGGVAGDALIEVSVGSHPHFTRDGLDVKVTVPITLKEAVGGARITVPTISGSVAMTVPPGANSGRTLRLKGQGVRQSEGVAGDQYVTLQIMLPEPPDRVLTSFIKGWTPETDQDPRRRLFE